MTHFSIASIIFIQMQLTVFFSYKVSNQISVVKTMQMAPALHTQKRVWPKKREYNSYKTHEFCISKTLWDLRCQIF